MFADLAKSTMVEKDAQCVRDVSLAEDVSRQRRTERSRARDARDASLAGLASTKKLVF